MSWLIALIIGAIVGWVYSYSVEEERRNYVADIIGGAVGGLAGVWFFANILGIGLPLTTALASITLLGVVWAVIGGIVIAAVVQGLAPSRVITREQRGPTYAQEIRRRKDDRDRYKEE